MRFYQRQNLRVKHFPKGTGQYYRRRDAGIVIDRATPGAEPPTFSRHSRDIDDFRIDFNAP